jgi:hypothetical protein
MPYELKASWIAFLIGVAAFLYWATNLVANLGR